MMIIYALLFSFCLIFHMDQRKDVAFIKSPLVSEKQMKEVLKAPASYINYIMEDEGYVEESKYVKGDGVYTIIFLDPVNYENPVVLYEKGETIPMAQETVVKFRGKIIGAYDEKNNGFTKETKPLLAINQIDLEEEEKGEDQLVLTKKIKKVKKEELIYTEIEKIKIYDSSIRMYVFIQNNSEEKIFLNDNTIKLMADDEEIPIKYEMLDKSSKLARSLSPQSGSHGILTFGTIPQQTKHLHLSYRLMNKEENIKIDYKVEL